MAVPDYPITREEQYLAEIAENTRECIFLNVELSDIDTINCGTSTTVTA